MIAAKLQDVLAKFQTVYFTQCLEQWCDCWAYCMKAKERYFEGDIINTLRTGIFSSIFIINH
jgi:hypothetical protein